MSGEAVRGRPALLKGFAQTKQARSFREAFGVRTRSRVAFAQSFATDAGAKTIESCGLVPYLSDLRWVRLHRLHGLAQMDCAVAAD